MKLSDNLKRIRKENNLSQEEFAEKLGVSRQAVSKWELDQSYPEMEKVILICKMFDYNVDDLVNGNVKEIEETKAARINLNKHIDGFFDLITKIVNMLEHMTFTSKMKFIIEQAIVTLILFLIFLLIGSILGAVLTIDTWTSATFKVLKTLLVSIYQILSLALGFSIFFHIFKIRYLDYYEIVKDIGEENCKIEGKELEGKDGKKIVTQKVQEIKQGFFKRSFNMLKSLETKERIKCILEQIVVFILICAIAIFIGTMLLIIEFNHFYTNSLEGFVPIYCIIAIIVSILFTKYNFKRRYLKYYDIEEEKSIKLDQEIRNPEKKVVFENRKERIIIRDPAHSESKLLKEILKGIINVIKIFAAAISGFFAFTFIGLIVLLVLSFMIVKSGFVFFGVLFCIIAGLSTNVIVLYLLYSFIISKKVKKHIITIIFFISLVICGVGIGFTFIGITQFNYMETRTEIDTYNVDSLSEMWTGGRIIFNFIETDSDEIKIEAVRLKYDKTSTSWINGKIAGIQFYEDESKTLDKIRDMIEDVNNKEFRDYYVTPKVNIYASWDNLEKIRGY